MKSCHLDGHAGRIDFDTGNCIFYGLIFEDILGAAKFLKGVRAGPTYKGKIVRGVMILKDVELDMWLSEGRWWPDKKLAVNAGKRICYV